jgi:hypothetical protein
MSVNIQIRMLVLLILLTASCAARNTRQESPQAGDRGPHQSSGEPDLSDLPVDLPFGLFINDQEVGPDMRATVPEGHVASIRFMSAGSLRCRLSVVHPDGETIVLGEWTGGGAAFDHVFPYGESHMIVSYGDRVYEILVVAEPAEPPAAESGCPGAFMDIRTDAKWEYRETFEQEYPAIWEYTIEQWAQDAQGNERFTLRTDRQTGIERKVDRTARLELTCTDATIYIDSATETEGDIEWVTEYEEGSIYIPADIHEGVEWERRGILTISTPEGNTGINLTERFRCTGEERVVTEAGEFDSAVVRFKIDRITPDESLTSEGTSWYVPGLGRVLSTGEMEGSPRLELISYEGATPR